MKADPALVKATKSSYEKIGEVEIFLQLYNKSMGTDDDIAPVVQLGLAVLMDKPIYVMIQKGDTIPNNLKLIAEATDIIDMKDPNSAEIMSKKIERRIKGLPHRKTILNKNFWKKPEIPMSIGLSIYKDKPMFFKFQDKSIQVSRHLKKLSKELNIVPHGWIPEDDKEGVSFRDSNGRGAMVIRM